VLVIERGTFLELAVEERTIVDRDDVICICKLDSITGSDVDIVSSGYLCSAWQESENEESTRKFQSAQVPQPGSSVVATAGSAVATAPSSPTSDAGNDGRTTLLFKNLTKTCTTHLLCGVLDEQGLKGCYDFVYVPIKLTKITSFGFGFVNFVSNHAARCATRWLQHATCHGVTSQDIGLELVWSELHQGFAAHVEKYQNSPIMHGSIPDHHKPMIFNRSGGRQPFPKPTSALKPPRTRRAAPVK